MPDSEENTINPHDNRSDFARFHDELDKHRRLGVRISDAKNKIPFIREDVGQIKGKLARRIAKRARVKLLKKQQDN